MLLYCEWAILNKTKVSALLFTIKLCVWVNQRNSFPPNVCRFLLPTRLQWVEPSGGGAEIRRRLAENGYVNLPGP